MTRFARRTIFVLFCAGACFAQFPVTGRIVDDIDGKPVANAQVGLLGDTAPAPVRTDAEGRFAFSVPAGKYKLAVEKTGFFPYPNEFVDVREGSPGDLALVLTRVRSITARLVWPNGDPVTRMAFFVQLRNGTRPPAGETVLRPPDIQGGQMHLSGFRPGRYVLLADPILALTVGHTGIPTQFPSPDAVERGEAIDLRFTATLDLGTLTIAEAAGVEVSGRVEVTEKISTTNFNRSQTAPPSINLVRPNGDIVAFAGRQPDGTFRFPKVPQGTYYLVGNTQTPNFAIFGVQEIQVGATPLSGLVLSLPGETHAITGRFEMETPEGRAGVAAQALLRITRPAWPAFKPGPADEEGNFSIYAPMGPGGPMGGLHFSMRGRIPTDVYVASFTQGQAVYTRDPFPVAVNGGPVHVLFKQDGATIRGQVPISGNPPFPAYIVLAPKEREAELFYRMASTDSKGAFQLQQIAPGTYDLFAFDREANYAGEPTLRAYQDAAVSVTVAAEESLTVHPNVVRIEK